MTDSKQAEVSRQKTDEHYPFAIMAVTFVAIVQWILSASPLSARDNDSDYEPMLYCVKIGAAIAHRPSLLNEYWDSALSVEGGFRLPYCVICEYTEFWIFGSYYRFPFKKGARFPIDSFDQHSIVVLSGEPVNVYSAFAGARIALRHREKRVIPYLFYGYGYIIRSDLVFESQSPLFPYFRREYDNSIALFLTFGLDCGLSGRLRLLFKFSGSSALTGDTEAAYFASKLGVSMR